MIVGKDQRHDGSRAGILEIGESLFGYFFLLSFISLGNRFMKIRKKTQESDLLKEDLKIRRWRPGHAGLNFENEFNFSS